MGGPALIDGQIHKECDNFSKNNFIVDGVVYPTAEHFFQCQKTFVEEERNLILASDNPLEAWVTGNKVTLRQKWDQIKVNVMYEGNKVRFEQNPEIAKSLCKTTGSISMSGSTNFWNYWNGIIMERIRAELRRSPEDLFVIEKTEKLMRLYENEK
jgi:ribA/ribD-fused uncharacterized protein